jgi:hypothetical protein
MKFTVHYVPHTHYDAEVFLTRYRSRMVVDPRSVLEEFGLKLEPEVEVRVYDSTADMRYLVIPIRPAGTTAMSEEELAGLVTRDSRSASPAPAGREAGPRASLGDDLWTRRPDSFLSYGFTVTTPGSARR